GAPLPFQRLYPPEEVCYVVNVAAAYDLNYLGGFRIELLGEEEPQRRAVAILHVKADRLASVRPLQLRGRETPVQLRKHVQDVLAGSERVGTEVRTRAIGVPRFAASNRDAVRLAGNGAADGVIRPWLA